MKRIIKVLVPILTLTACTDSGESVYDYHSRMYDSFMVYYDSSINVLNKQNDITWSQIFITQRNTIRVIKGQAEAEHSVYDSLQKQKDSLTISYGYLRQTKEYYSRAMDSVYPLTQTAH